METFFTVFGQKEGRSVTKLSSGHVYVASFERGQCQGACVRFDSGGSIVNMSRYVDGKIHGLQKQIYANGIIGGLTTWRHGVEVGPEFHWTDLGILSSATNRFVNGDEQYEWYTNGQLKSVVTRKNDKRHGISYICDERGRVWSQTRWEHGIRIQEWFRYFDQPMLVESQPMLEKAAGMQSLAARWTKQR